jgi:cyclopropane fatty-acyl-phospholipid synthase-like methyltransferase
MSQEDLSERLERYYRRSRLSFDLFLGGAKHFGYYSPGPPPSERQARERMEELLAERLRLAPGMRVLDAGCGQGVVSVHLCRRHRCEIDGVTVLPFEVPAAERLARRNGVSGRARYHLKDYSATGFPDESFDAIYSMETLCHALDLGRTLREFHRLLKAGGRVAFFEYTLGENGRFPEHHRARLEGVIHRTAMHSLAAFVPPRFCGMLQSAGFEQVRSEDITPNFTPSITHYERILRWPYRIVNLIGLGERFPNVTSIVDVLPMVREGLVGYHVFSARKG